VPQLCDWNLVGRSTEGEPTTNIDRSLMKKHRAATVNTEPKTMMTMQEIADYLRVTRSTVHRLLKRNAIPAFRIGRHWRFNLAEIDRWCASRMLSENTREKT